MIRLLTALFLLLAAAPVIAADEAHAISFDYAVLAGLMWPNFDNADPGINLGARVIVLDAATPSLSLEGEVTTTVADGEIGSSDFSLSSVAAYLVWRSAGTFNWKVKGGALYEQVDVGSGDENDTGLSAGVGVGFKAWRGSIDLEATLIEEDAFFFSAAYQF